MLGLKCHLVTCRHSLNYRIKTLKSASKFHKKNEPDSWFKTHEVNFGGYWRSPKLIEPLNRVFLKMYYILPHQHPGIYFHSKFCSRYEGHYSPRTIEFHWVIDKVTRHHQEVIKFDTLFPLLRYITPLILMTVMYTKISIVLWRSSRMEDFEKHNVQKRSNKRWRWKRKPKVGKDIKMKQLTSGTLASKINFIKFVSVTSTYVNYQGNFRTLS